MIFSFQPYAIKLCIAKSVSRYDPTWCADSCSFLFLCDAHHAGRLSERGWEELTVQAALRPLTHCNSCCCTWEVLWGCTILGEVQADDAQLGKAGMAVTLGSPATQHASLCSLYRLSQDSIVDDLCMWQDEL